MGAYSAELVEQAGGKSIAVNVAVNAVVVGRPIAETPGKKKRGAGRVYAEVAAASSCRLTDCKGGAGKGAVGKENGAEIVARYAVGKSKLDRKFALNAKTRRGPFARAALSFTGGRQMVAAGSSAIDVGRSNKKGKFNAKS